jgi:hypothetical protein
MGLFKYTESNVRSVARMRSSKEKRRQERELEFNRTHKFKRQPLKAKRLGIKNKSYGKWVKRKKPLRKIRIIEYFPLLTKREAEKFAKRLRKKTTTKLLSERQKNWKLIGKRRITRNKRRRR